MPDGFVPPFCRATADFLSKSYIMRFPIVGQSRRQRRGGASTRDDTGMAFADIFRGVPGLSRPLVDDIELYWSPTEKVQTTRMLRLDHRLPWTVHAGIGALITGTRTDGLIVVSDVYVMQPGAVFRADRAILQIAKRPTFEAEDTPISGLRRRKQPPARPNRKGMEIAHHPNYRNVKFVRLSAVPGWTARASGCPRRPAPRVGRASRQRGTLKRWRAPISSLRGSNPLP